MARKYAAYFARPVKHIPVWNILFAGTMVGHVRRYGEHGYLARCEGHDIGGADGRAFLRHFNTLADAKKVIQCRLNGTH
jgi:hypothetical protein